MLILINFPLRLLAGLDYPKITEHPLDVMVPRYEPVTLNCKAEGIPTPTITWFVLFPCSLAEKLSRLAEWFVSTFIIIFFFWIVRRYKDGEPLKIEQGTHRMILPAGGLFFLKVSANNPVRGSARPVISINEL